MKKIKEYKEIIIVLIILALGFYWFQVRPNQIIKNQELEKAKSLQLSIQCRVDGEKKLEEDKKESINSQYSDGTTKCYYMEPKFIFNKELNSCLYFGGYSCDLEKKYTEGFMKGTNATRWNRHIVDVYSNKTITSVFINDSSNVSEWERKNIDEFWVKSKEFGFE